MILTLTNDYHHTKTTVRATPGQKFSRRKTTTIRRRLCKNRKCTCGDSLGRSGQQPIHPIALKLFPVAQDLYSWMPVEAQTDLTLPE
jgi:hypothetical protein